MFKKQESRENSIDSLSRHASDENTKAQNNDPYTQPLYLSANVGSCAAQEEDEPASPEVKQSNNISIPIQVEAEQANDSSSDHEDHMTANAKVGSLNNAPINLVAEHEIQRAAFLANEEALRAQLVVYQQANLRLADQLHAEKLLRSKLKKSNEEQAAIININHKKLQEQTQKINSIEYELKCEQGNYQTAKDKMARWSDIFTDNISQIKPAAHTDHGNFLFKIYARNLELCYKDYQIIYIEHTQLCEKLFKIQINDDIYIEYMLTIKKIMTLFVVMQSVYHLHFLEYFRTAIKGLLEAQVGSCRIYQEAEKYIDNALQGLGLSRIQARIPELVYIDYMFSCVLKQLDQYIRPSRSMSEQPELDILHAIAEHNFTRFKQIILRLQKERSGDDKITNMSFATQLFHALEMQYTHYNDVQSKFEMDLSFTDTLLSNLDSEDSKSLIIKGPAGCGKTTFIENFFKYTLNKFFEAEDLFVEYDLNVASIQITWTDILAYSGFYSGNDARTRAEILTFYQACAWMGIRLYLIIDEIHTGFSLQSAQEKQSSTDAIIYKFMQELKAAMATDVGPRLTFIGLTTEDEYLRYIQRTLRVDKALGRRLKNPIDYPLMPYPRCLELLEKNIIKYFSFTQEQNKKHMISFALLFSEVFTKYARPNNLNITLDLFLKQY